MGELYNLATKKLSGGYLNADETAVLEGIPLTSEQTRSVQDGDYSFKGMSGAQYAKSKLEVTGYGLMHNEPVATGDVGGSPKFDVAHPEVLKREIKKRVAELDLLESES